MTVNCFTGKVVALAVQAKLIFVFLLLVFPFIPSTNYLPLSMNLTKETLFFNHFFNYVYS